MNPSDDEERSGAAVKTSEEIEELLEPQAIPDERIVRHAEKNDSYREAPTLTNDEEIIQPPLEQLEEQIQTQYKKEVEQEVVVENSMSQEEIVLERAIPSDAVPQEVIPQDSPPTHLLSQADILQGIALPPYEESQQVVEETKIETQSVPAVPAVPAVAEVPPAVDQEAVPEAVLSQPPVYHTLSGGPDTLQHDIAEHAKEVRPEPPLGMKYVNATSGYTIPDPNYISHNQPGMESSSNFFLVLLSGIIVIVGGTIAYLYLYVPETFKQASDAIVIIKDQIFKK